IRVGKRGGCASTPQAFIDRLMIAEARRGERVVRLKGGDPFVFGRGGEECDALRAAGIQVEVIGGLTAGISAPASIGLPVTDRRFTHGVALVTGHTGDGATAPDWAALARSRMTLVIYMGVANAAAIVDALQRGGMAGDTPAAVICSAHTVRQRHVLCTLEKLTISISRHGLSSPAILVVGDVVRACDAWDTQASRAGADVAGDSRTGTS
ncbi:MAG: uroporphyrinogen-III C-methyltransferase, partial [Burkholderiaceae bacterium]